MRILLRDEGRNMKIMYKLLLRLLLIISLSSFNEVSNYLKQILLRFLEHEDFYVDLNTLIQKLLLLAE